MHDLIEKLDRILLKNTVIKTEHIYSSLVEYISSLLRDYCVLFEKRYYADFYEYRLLYSCNDNKSCVIVVIKSIPVTLDLDRINISVTLRGAECE
jgi:hypothetical protein